jgi:hypothetical protein
MSWIIVKNENFHSIISGKPMIEDIRMYEMIVISLFCFISLLSSSKKVNVII